MYADTLFYLYHSRKSWQTEALELKRLYVSRFRVVPRVNVEKRVNVWYKPGHHRRILTPLSLISNIKPWEFFSNVQWIYILSIIFFPGSLPTMEDDNVTREACLQTVNNTCNEKIAIQILNCGNRFYVYRLPNTTTNSGYCFGNFKRYLVYI